MPDIVHLIIIITMTCASATLMYLCSYKMIQIYQMSSYRTKEVFAWLKKDKFDYLARYFSLSFFSFVPMALFVVCFGGYEYVNYLGFAFFVFLSISFYIIIKRQVKVPLKFTMRVKRLSVVLIILLLLFSLLFIWITPYIFLQYSLVALMPLLLPFLTFTANAITLPIERIINNSYLNRAKSKLSSMPSLIKIGITGSYGKTTTKNILSAFLSKKYNVCASPKSYNTPMGLTRVINDQLTADHQVFIAEMGARYKGDINELCRLVNPSIGILTAIGEMHLETFGTLDCIKKTKYELIDSLPSDGLAVFCGDDNTLLQLFDHCAKDKLATKIETSRIRCTYSNVVINENGTSFDLELDGKTKKIHTLLLGSHIPGLISLCALLAYELGVSLEQIAEASSHLEQIPHRLQLIKENNMSIIDDAYNSNPQGAKNALNLLGSFGGTRIIITPGMIELGDKSKQLHHELGMEIAKNADYAILVGRNAAQIKSGIAATNIMKLENVIVTKTLSEAMSELSKISGDKKSILFENDLPDNY